MLSLVVIVFIFFIVFEIKCIFIIYLFWVNKIYKMLDKFNEEYLNILSFFILNFIF